MTEPAADAFRRIDHYLLSTGQRSTLGVWRDNCAALFGPNSPPVAYFDSKITEQGRDEPVRADERQVMALVASLMQSGGHP